MILAEEVEPCNFFLPYCLVGSSRTAAVPFWGACN